MPDRCCAASPAFRVLVFRPPAGAPLAVATACRDHLSDVTTRLMLAHPDCRVVPQRLDGTDPAVLLSALGRRQGAAGGSGASSKIE